MEDQKGSKVKKVIVTLSLIAVLSIILNISGYYTGGTQQETTHMVSPFSSFIVVGLGITVVTLLFIYKKVRK